MKPEKGLVDVRPSHRLRRRFYCPISSVEPLPQRASVVAQQVVLLTTNPKYNIALRQHHFSLAQARYSPNVIPGRRSIDVSSWILLAYTCSPSGLAAFT